MKFDSKLEEDFYTRFQDRNVKFKTSSKFYDVKALRPATRNAPYDFSLKVGNTTIALLELKSKYHLEIFDYSFIDKYAAEHDIRFVILSDGERFIITDKKKPYSKELVDFDGFIDIISKTENLNVEYLKEEIAKIIHEILTYSQFPLLKELLSLSENQLINSIDYNEIEQTFSFRNPSDINNLENRIFRLLLKDEKQLTKVYRYTSLETIFSMLNYNSFRMNCLVGMNDTTEVNYAENYITGSNKDYTKAPWQTIDAYNRRFISSCSLKEDDLTQWRLYGDGSKGACLIYNVVEEQLNSKFILKRISYGKANREHPELDLIKEVIAKLKDKLNIDFEFRTLSTWRHFFKPYDYAIEEEVRLLFILNDEDVKKGWLLTSSHNILNPFVEFKLNDGLPLQLSEIMLGPLCAEKETNKKQFEQFIRELRRRKKKVIEKGVEKEVDEYNISKLTVTISDIKNYR